MDKQLLENTARQMVQDGKGILAADESNGSCQKRFDALGVECTEETRRQYRQILLTVPHIGDALTGVIFYDETFWQNDDKGVAFRENLINNGVLPGIKVDQGLIDLPGFDNEKLTQGLDGLPERMQKYAEAGARFAKWRSVIAIGEGIPTDACIDANAFVLSRYARICQDNNIVPMVEPEVLFDGTHTIGECESVMSKTLDMLFEVMRYYKVHLPGVILKTSMVLPGKDSGAAIDHQDVAVRTVKVLHEHVPADVGGVVFLSGGQVPTDALINLNRIKQNGPHPWGITFSFSRALQDPVLKAWAAKLDDITGAEDIFVQQLKYAHEATLGKLDESEKMDDFVSHSQDL
jgi:fructose-bisphosphate aldolase class I